MVVTIDNAFNLSLVACYGEKSRQLAGLIDAAQAQLADCLADAFIPYAREQVHATLISLEGFREQGALLNRNYAELRGERRVMNLEAVFDQLARPGVLPFEVSIAGYQRDSVYPFTSRGLSPWQRSFSVQGNIAVAMGWPRRGSAFPDTLQALRASFRQANVLHKYHHSDNDIDNDFFFVLGNIDTEKADHDALLAAGQHMRTFFAACDPLAVTIDRAQLSVIAYRDPRAPPDSTRRFSLDEVDKSPEKILALYPEH